MKRKEKKGLDWLKNKKKGKKSVFGWECQGG